ncbi:hypothetical protein [uncultured Olsenella sp.]|uniref:hypothetical protein n=1 Tax=uncultured Olsenella sp. TaxID=190764 RepID=UPI0026DAC1DB|nr:hypothetical protein [uncultured Olsenella sp.]
MGGRCERVYVRLTPGEKDRALDLASRNGLTVSQLVRVLIQLPADYASEGARTAVVLDRTTAGGLEREMRRWGNHYNQAVHALNTIALFASRGGSNIDYFVEQLECANRNLEDVKSGERGIEGKLRQLEGTTLVDGR